MLEVFERITQRATRSDEALARYRVVFGELRRTVVVVALAVAGWAVLGGVAAAAAFLLFGERVAVAAGAGAGLTVVGYLGRRFLRRRPSA